MRVVARLDRHQELALLPLGDEEAGHLLASVPEEERGQCWWIVLRDGTVVRGDEGGGVLLLEEVHLTGPLGRALRAVRLSPVVDTFDRVLARYRSRLGRIVPDGPAPRRYP